MCAALAIFAPLSATSQTPTVMRKLPAMQRPADATRAPPARDEFVGKEYVAGVWSVDSKGTDYGPWQPVGSTKLAVQFAPADASGVMHGFVVGKPILFLGRKVGATEFRGIWMETAGPANANPTGRWGLARAAVGIAGKSIQIALSMGYRKPVPNSAGPGFPGRTLSGRYYLNEGPSTSMPSRSRVQMAWDKLVAAPGPFPTMHGVYPDAKIDAAIEAWTRDDKLSASWGRTTTVDPCAAKCMGREPVRIGFDVAQLIASGTGTSEIYGRVVVAPKVVEAGKPAQAIRDAQNRAQIDLISIRREDARSIRGDDRFMMVSAPPPSTLKCRNTRFTARYILPPGVWTDPLRDIDTGLAGTLSDRDLTRKGDDRFKLNRILPVKKSIVAIDKAKKDILAQDASVDFCFEESVVAMDTAKGEWGGYIFFKIHAF
ncbi:hypothetical protein ABS767_12740 [Sphingomonas sp. ST-64]|uniref:Uncharacterized protein n=1 Tax=Sphingomonas plantiphila TaxID=3163295 RepID=A0ABW8YP75_9SPHN